MARPWNRYADRRRAVVEALKAGERPKWVAHRLGVPVRSVTRYKTQAGL